jgi:DNA polymerase III gamma/tau subunit
MLYFFILWQTCRLEAFPVSGSLSKIPPDDLSGCRGTKPYYRYVENEIKHRKIAHAYLFSGSKDGENHCARILAKGVNCPNAKEGDPCNECEFCRGVNDATLLDVIEIDALPTPASTTSGHA